MGEIGGLLLAVVLRQRGEAGQVREQKGVVSVTAREGQCQFGHAVPSVIVVALA